jgi:hypothetical protein
VRHKLFNNLESVGIQNISLDDSYVIEVSSCNMDGYLKYNLNTLTTFYFVDAENTYMGGYVDCVFYVKIYGRKNEHTYYASSTNGRPVKEKIFRFGSEEIIVENEEHRFLLAMELESTYTDIAFYNCMLSVMYKSAKDWKDEYV